MRTKHFYEKLGFVQVGWTREEDFGVRYYEKLMDPDKPHERIEIADLIAV